jgi:predicted CoA-binding protein
MTSNFFQGSKKRKYSMVTKQEKFWERDNFLVITDGTKPAIKWTIDELKKRGRAVTVLDYSDKPVEGSIQNISEVPDGVRNVVIGITKREPARVIEKLAEKGIIDFWVHWKTDTCDVNHLEYDPNLRIITGRCPMMYLGNGASIHGFHRLMAKTLGKF